MRFRETSQNTKSFFLEISTSTNSPKHLFVPFVFVDEKTSGHSAGWVVVFVLSSFWLLVSCSSGNRPKPLINPSLRSITAYPGAATVAAGLTQQYSAIGNCSDGSSMLLTSVTWATSDATISRANLNGLVIAVKQGNVRVTASLGAITGNAALTVGPPNTALLTEPRDGMQVVPITSEGQIPADFSVASAMTSLYGNFDPSTQSSVAALPPGSEENSFFRAEQKVKGLEVRPFWTALADDSGVTKVFLSTYAGRLGQGYTCHACAPIIGMASFIKSGGGWDVESSTKTAVFLGQWGEPPSASIQRIGPGHVGVKLEGLGSFSTYVSILVPWNGEIREAFDTIVGEGNGQVCGDEEGMQPCVGTRRTIAFAKGANPGYDDIVLTLSGTKLTEKPPYEVIDVSGTEHLQFSEGKYVHAIH